MISRSPILDRVISRQDHVDHYSLLFAERARSHARRRDHSRSSSPGVGRVRARRHDGQRRRHRKRRVRAACGLLIPRLRFAARRGDAALAQRRSRALAPVQRRLARPDDPGECRRHRPRAARQPIAGRRERRRLGGQREAPPEQHQPPHARPAHLPAAAQRRPAPRNQPGRGRVHFPAGPP
jgi:hypothetical protein